MGFEIVTQDIFLLKSLNRAALGQYCAIGKVGFCFSPSTPVNAKLYSYPRAEDRRFVPAECYSLPAVMVDTPVEKNSLYISANRGPSGRSILIRVF